MMLLLELLLRQPVIPYIRCDCKNDHPGEQYNLGKLLMSFYNFLKGVQKPCTIFFIGKYLEI